MKRNLIALALSLAALPAGAAEDTELASSGDDDDPFDFNIRVGYVRSLRRAAVKRELIGEVQNRPLLSTLTVKDLRYTQVRHTLPLRAEIGIWQDLQLHVEAPLVISDQRELLFAHNEGKSCTFSGQENVELGELPTCVDGRNSTVVRDGLIDVDPADQTYWGTEGEERLVGGSDIGASEPGVTLPKRSGLDQLNVGLTYALLSQARDDTKPTWTLGFEWRIAVGEAMDYDPKRPDDNTSVGRGIHDLVVQTAFAKTLTYVEPFMKIWWAYPIAKDDSLFKDHKGGQDKVGPQQHAGVDFGLEIFALNRPESKQRIGFEIGGGITASFEGRGYSEMWEVFRRNPELDGPCGVDGDDDGALDSRGETWASCDLTPGQGGDDDGLIQHPGVTDIENYATLGGRLAVRTQVGEFVKFRIGLALAHDLEHYISFTDAGQDRGDEDVLVTPNDAREIHPLHRPLIDQIGRRFRVEETTVFEFFVSGMILF